MSVGGATDHPAFAKALLKETTPEKTYQNNMQFSDRTAKMSVVQEDGHEGLSEPKCNALNEPRLVSSIRQTSSGLDAFVTIWISVPESSLSDGLPCERYVQASTEQKEKR